MARSPLERPVGLREVDRDQHVGIGRHHVHRAVHDQRVALVAVRDAGVHDRDDLQVPDVPRRHLRERAVARVGLVAVRQAPLAGRHWGDQPRVASACAGHVDVRCRALRGVLVVCVGRRRAGFVLPLGAPRQINAPHAIHAASMSRDAG